MKPYVPSTRIAVRESIDEDLSDDIEDDVFIRDGKSIKVTFKVMLICFTTHTESCNSVFRSQRYTDDSFWKIYRKNAQLHSNTSFT